MTNKNNKQNPPVSIPQSWTVPENEIQKAWDIKAEQFAQFKEHFEKKLSDKES
jgi:uncharacterized protein YeaO (DUF488 family)